MKSLDRLVRQQQNLAGGQYSGVKKGGIVSPRPQGMMPLSPHNPNQQLGSYGINNMKSDKQMGHSNYKMMAGRQMKYGQPSTNGSSNASSLPAHARNDHSFDRGVLNKTLLPEQQAAMST